MDFKFKNHEHVSFDNGVIKGTGFVIGCSTMEQPVIGAIYIVSVSTCNIELPNITYPYSTVVIPECNIQTLDN